MTKYELMPENETHDEDATDYDQASEETYVTKNLAEFESKRIHLSLEETLRSSTTMSSNVVDYVSATCWTSWSFAAKKTAF